MAVSDNLGLYLPDREDYISVQRDLKSNYEIIDEHAGMVEDGIAIVINGDTAPRAITSGQYLMIKNHSTLATGGYHATANIANGASVTSSNVVADSDGIANALNSKMTGKFNRTTALSWGNYGTESDYTQYNLSAEVHTNDTLLIEMGYNARTRYLIACPPVPGTTDDVIEIVVRSNSRAELYFPASNKVAIRINAGSAGDTGYANVRSITIWQKANF